MSCDMSKLNQITGVWERVKYFDSCQEGGKANAVVFRGHFVWPNGSYRELSEGGLGILCDVSWLDKNDQQQIRENLWWRRRYAERKLSDSVKEFEAAKAELKNRAQHAELHGSQPPAQSEIKALRKLRHNVGVWSKRLNEIFEQLNPQPEPYVYSKEERESMEKNRNDAESVLSALDKLEV